MYNLIIPKISIVPSLARHNRRMCLDARGLIKDPPKKIRMGRTKTFMMVRSMESPFVGMVNLFVVDWNWCYIWLISG